MVKYLSNAQGQVAIKIDKPFYLPGETIRGIIYIKINKADIGAGTLFIKLVGMEKANQIDEFNQFYSFKNYFYKKKKKVSFFGNSLPKMAVKKYFEIEVPDKYPSIAINYYKQVQCRILYFLSLIFCNADNSLVIKPKKTHRVVVHIIQKPQLSMLKSLKITAQTQQLKRCCFSVGSCSITAFLQKTAFIVGEEMQIQLIIDNSDSSISLESLQISVQSHLQVSYKQIKRHLHAYFGLTETEIKQHIPAHGQKVFQAQLNIAQSKPEYIFPQTSVKTQKISFQYNLCIVAIFQSSLSSTQNACRILIPIEIYQHNLRTMEQENQFCEDNQPQFSQFKSLISLNRSGLNNTVNRVKNYKFADHTFSGYGPQDGYDGKPRKYDPEDSLDQDELLDKKGAIEQLYLRKMNEKQQQEKEEEFVEQFDVSEQGFSQVSIDRPHQYQQKQQNSFTIFSKQNNNNNNNSITDIQFNQVQVQFGDNNYIPQGKREENFNNNNDIQFDQVQVQVEGNDDYRIRGKGEENIDLIKDDENCKKQNFHVENVIYDNQDSVFNQNNGEMSMKQNKDGETITVRKEDHNQKSAQISLLMFNESVSQQSVNHKIQAKQQQKQ